MSKRARKLTNDITDLGELIIKSLFIITMVVLMAKTLLPIIFGETIFVKYASYLIGVIGVFIIVVSKEVRKEILNLGH
jgi:hypothetical protein